MDKAACELPHNLLQGKDAKIKFDMPFKRVINSP